MEDSVVRRDAASLVRQEQVFTNQGAPLPGVVGTDLPAARPEDHDGPKPRGAAQAMTAAARLESLQSAERHIRTAEEERDSLGTFVQEDLYVGSCLKVDALEQKLESRLKDHKGVR